MHFTEVSCTVCSKTTILIYPSEKQTNKQQHAEICTELCTVCELVFLCPFRSSPQALRAQQTTGLNHPKMNIPMTDVTGFFFSVSFNKQELKTPFLTSGERISPIRLKSF